MPKAWYCENLWSRDTSMQWNLWSGDTSIQWNLWSGDTSMQWNLWSGDTSIQWNLWSEDTSMQWNLWSGDTSIQWNLWSGDTSIQWNLWSGDIFLPNSTCFLIILINYMEDRFTFKYLVCLNTWSIHPMISLLCLVVNNCSKLTMFTSMWKHFWVKFHKLTSGTIWDWLYDILLIHRCIDVICMLHDELFLNTDHVKCMWMHFFDKFHKIAWHNMYVDWTIMCRHCINVCKSNQVQFQKVDKIDVPSDLVNP